MDLSQSLAEASAVNWRFGSHANKVRFRRLECDHAVRQALRSLKLAKHLIATAEADHVLSVEEANALRTEIRIE